MQFSIESVREVARVLAEANLAEVTLERSESADGAKARLVIRRNGIATVVVAPEAEVAALDAAASSPGVVSAGVPQNVLVSAECVGIFREAKTPVEVGTKVSKKQLLGTIESLRVPNEIYAPAAGVVSQVLVSDGQGVEWGQMVMEIVPESAS